MGAPKTSELGTIVTEKKKQSNRAAAVHGHFHLDRVPNPGITVTSFLALSSQFSKKHLVPSMSSQTAAVTLSITIGCLMQDRKGPHIL